MTELTHSTSPAISFKPMLPAALSHIRLLDLCCKAGGCSVGYKEAADELGIEIEIVGVDLEPQPNYPFQFIQADAVTFLKKNGHLFTHIHASPPCQKYTNGTAKFRKQGKEYRDNLSEIREAIEATGLPGIIENVPTAPLRPDIVLRGDMFGLKVLRRRHFEAVNWKPKYCPELPKKVGSVKNGDYAQVFGKGQKKGSGKGNMPFKMSGTVNEIWSHAMGINWMNNLELAEAIPPAYTRFIGREFLKVAGNVKILPKGRD